MGSSKGSFVQRLGNIEEDKPLPLSIICEGNGNGIGNDGLRVPEAPFESMEFLSRSWSSSSIEVMQAVSPTSPHRRLAMITRPPTVTPPSSPQHSSNEDECRTPTDKSPLIPKDFQFDLEKFTGLQEEGSSNHWRCNNLKTWLWTQQTLNADMNLGQRLQKKLFPKNVSVPNLKTLIQSASVKKWIKEVKDKKKEATRLQNAEAHAAVSVAGLAAALAAIAAERVETTAMADPQNKTNAALASAAALVAAQCVEVANTMGADRSKISSAINSAINVRSAGDILTLTAAAATSLRGAATLKSRPKKEWHPWNTSSSSIIPFERDGACTPTSSISEEMASTESEADFCHNRALLAKGSDLVVHFQNGRPVLKSVSVFLNIQAQVILRIRDKHITRAFAKPKESIILEIQAWPDKCSVPCGDRLCSFCVSTSDGNITLEFRDYAEHQVWLFTISRMLSLVDQMKEK